MTRENSTERRKKKKRVCVKEKEKKELGTFEHGKPLIVDDTRAYIVEIVKAAYEA